ncbi:hypothetical protein E4U30_005687 [Claviceps sp. LM220 group G6]|nr:hypothetical protein E4U30_005687 [Claviceps sp. LM220 group G6]
MAKLPPVPLDWRQTVPLKNPFFLPVISVARKRRRNTTVHESTIQTLRPEHGAQVLNRGRRQEIGMRRVLGNGS